MHRTWMKAWKTPGKHHPDTIPRFAVA